MAVKSALDKLGIHHIKVQLGEVEIMENITEEQRLQLKSILLETGLELMDDQRAIQIERIKNVIIEMIHYSDEIPKTNCSTYISDKLGHEYTYLANLFSEVTGTTIEHYVILHKIERAKELLLYDDLNITEISYRLNYSSVAHLSSQFKKVTGLTPTYYKEIENKRRSATNNV